MATVTGLTAARMLAIEAASIVDGAVDLSGHLILTTEGGTDIDAGSVIGPTGPTGAGLNGTVIAQTTNLNTIIAPGAYVQLVDAWATAILNYPQVGGGGWLTVAGTTGGVLLQTYTSLHIANTPAIYRRESSNGGTSWSTWQSQPVGNGTGEYRFIRYDSEVNVRFTNAGKLDSYALRGDTTPVGLGLDLLLNTDSGGNVIVGKTGVTTRTFESRMPIRAKKEVIADASITLSTNTNNVGFVLGNGGIFRNAGTGCLIQMGGDNTHYVLVEDDGTRLVRIPAMYSRTTTGAANGFVGSNGTIARSTSLRAAKVNIEDAPEDWAEKVLALRPRIWTDKANLERYSHMVDRELAGEEIDWSKVDVHQVTERIAGFVAEEVQDAGLDIFTSNDNDGNLNGIAYDRITAGLVSVVQKQQKQIDELRDLVNTLMPSDSSSQSSTTVKTKRST